jgi:hypothetical protein
VSVETAAVDAVPLVGFAPLQPPDASQLLASDVVHTRVERSPGSTVAGVAASEIVGIGAVEEDPIRTITYPLIEPPVLP